MKAVLSATKQLFAQLWSDVMLIVLMFVPILMGLVFRLGVPALEGYLCARLTKAAILAPYYPVFDLLLSLMTPIMFTAAGAMVILDEADLGLTRAIAVTPVGRRGYLLSRIGVPAAFSTLYCVIATLVFRISDIRTSLLVLLDLCSGVMGVVTALMIASFAKNKVEGLAYSKLSGLFVLGLPVALLVPVPSQYAAGLLPSLWMTKAVMEDASVWLLPAFLTAVLWCALLYRRFSQKLLG